MRKTILLFAAAFLLCAGARPAYAQNPSAAKRLVYGTPPPTCDATTGDVYIDTSVTPPEPKYCGAANTYVRFSDGKVNAQPGTSYTFVTGDNGKLVTFGNASAVAASLPAANSTTFLSGWHAHVVNLGAGVVTITPVSGTVNGAASIPLAQNQGAHLFSDGSNYSAIRTAAASHAHAQSEITGLISDLAAKLGAANNLSDLANATTARANLGLGTAATQNVADFAAAIHAHAAADVTSGTVATARLGSGTASGSTFLRGDQTWAAPPVTSVFGRTGAVVAVSNDYTWAQVNKATSSLADITTRSASDLSSGTLPDGRFPATLPAASGANLTDVAWSQSAVVSVTAATTLTSTAFGKLHVCSGTSANYALTLPAAAGNSGRVITLAMANALTKLVTVTAAGGELIDGQATRVMWKGESAVLMSDGAGWTKVAGKSVAMYAQMHLGANQSIGNASMTKLNLDTVDADNASLADTTNKQLVIRRGGSYSVYGQAWLNGTAATLVLMDFYKSGAQLFETYATSASASTNAVPNSGVIATLAAADTVDLRAYQNSGGSAPIAGAASTQYTYLYVVEIPAW